MIAFYYVDKNYLSYLRNYETKVPLQNYNSHDKFYCGVVLSIGNVKYYAPISHDTTKQQTSFLIYNKGKVISSIKFSFMIPVPNKCLTKIDFNTIAINDLNYANLLRAEYNYCSAHEQEINKKAMAVYKIGRNPKHVLHRFCCDFKKLEVLCDNYS